MRSYLVLAINAKKKLMLVSAIQNVAWPKKRQESSIAKSYINIKHKNEL